ncbi:zinc finger MYM-type protein 1-like [Melanaphis sacchari]|uniref:zinc finger MYM-type protein 1-like n=1 Tax=Melanaphis sacchari TaxID=742174 RepID=UPI000DC130D4|nr:zinc finger MYM-type protein 1-like [Melanaphis sacchari]
MSDIRNFLQKKRKIELSPSSINEGNHDIGDLSNLSTNISNSSQQKEEPQLLHQLTVGANKLDIGLYLNSYVDDELRLKLLKDPWVPSKTYDFKKDLTNGSTRAHEISIWHKDAINASQHFLNSKERKQLSVHEQIDSAFNREIEENRLKLRSIISSILFCAKHDLPLRGKNDEGSVFTDLLQFRVESGDEILNKHLKSGAKNALYISHEVQNELIKTCANVLRQNIIEEVKLSSVFSVLADETADISGTEQLSIGVRYLFYDVKFQKHKICEEFFGYSPLTKLDSKSIAKTIIEFLESCNLDLNRLVGQGYDGCATMAGHISGVQKLINEAYPMALFFHCTSHVLNLVFNDLNNRESTLRRQIIPNIPLLCETRWSAKYKSIRIFADNFIVIVKALEELSKSTANSKTKIKSYQLFTAATTPVFIVTLQVIAVYSAKFEPVCNLLQQVNINLKTVNNHITKLVDILQLYRNDSSTEFSVLFAKSKEIAEELDVEIRPPRVAARQSQRSNHPSTNHEEFFRISIFVPYLDSVISSLKVRFSKIHNQSFSLMDLHPYAMKNMSKEQFICTSNDIVKLYGNILSSNFVTEATTWYEMWNNDTKPLDSIEYLDLIEMSQDFYPAVADAIKIGATLPTTTCSIERSFSTLRRVKTWNKATMNDDRLSGLCMMSVHRKRLGEDTKFIENAIEEFGKKPRRLQLLFKK